MIFDVAGPFEIPRYGKKKIITRESQRQIKQNFEAWERGLSEACGCYVFAVRAGRGYTPHYVGQACKSPLLSESMNSTNVNKYNTACDDKGTPVLFLLPLRTPGGKFRKRRKVDTKLPALDFLETWLIATALQKNPNLVNNRETYFLKNIHVTGLLNSKQGGSTGASRKLKKALW